MHTNPIYAKVPVALLILVYHAGVRAGEALACGSFPEASDIGHGQTDLDALVDTIAAEVLGPPESLSPSDALMWAGYAAHVRERAGRELEFHLVAPPEPPR